MKFSKEELELVEIALKDKVTQIEDRIIYNDFNRLNVITSKEEIKEITDRTYNLEIEKHKYENILRKIKEM